MPSFIDHDQFVQTSYTNFHGAGFPGQFFRETDAWNRELQSFAVDTDVFVFAGRLVVQAVAQVDDGSLPLLKPFSVKPLDGTETDATTFAGLVYRPFSGTLNDSSENNERKAGFAEKMIAPLVPFGKGVQLHVRQLPNLTVVFDDAVYVARSDGVGVTNDLFTGEFTNDDDSGSAELILVPNARWYISKTATVDDQDGVIEFN